LPAAAITAGKTGLSGPSARIAACLRLFAAHHAVSVQTTLDSLARLFAENPDESACVIMEPVFSIIQISVYLKKSATILSPHGALVGIR